MTTKDKIAALVWGYDSGILIGGEYMPGEGGNSEVRGFQLFDPLAKPDRYKYSPAFPCRGRWGEHEPEFIAGDPPLSGLHETLDAAITEAYDRMIAAHQAETPAKTDMDIIAEQCAAIDAMRAESPEIGARIAQDRTEGASACNEGGSGADAAERKETGIRGLYVNCSASLKQDEL